MRPLRQRRTSRGGTRSWSGAPTVPRGSRVRHQVFGDGEVIGYAGHSILLAFDRAGYRRLDVGLVVGDDPGGGRLGRVLAAGRRARHPLASRSLASRRTAVFTADNGQEPLHGIRGVVDAHRRQGVEGMLGQR